MDLGVSNYCRQLELRALLNIANLLTFYETINIG